jgi:glycosyltransferase involved in cell wall biosynthesis
MRLGVVWDPNVNANYRAVHPMRAMDRRGHEVVWPGDDGGPDLRRLADCDVVHVYRRSDPDTFRALTQLVGNGIPIVYDNDDDYTLVPKGSAMYKMAGGLKGQRLHAATLKVAKLAACVTTTNERLGEKYRRGGADRVEVIGNYLSPEMDRSTRRHDGIVIGWIAALEHYADATELGLARVLTQLMGECPDVRVECVGVDLKLPERYTHDFELDFQELPRRIGGFDIGIAPLADLPVNWMRSDIKVKEYAASGVPWLASAIGPYEELGEAHGGRLVSADGWYEALWRLVTKHRERRRLARNAKKWAKHQTIDAAAARWEAVFAEAASSKRSA